MNSESTLPKVGRRLYAVASRYFAVPEHYIAFYVARGVDVLRSEGDDCHTRMQCPFEDVNHSAPPLRLNTMDGRWFCHACGTGGHVIQWWIAEQRTIARHNGQPEPSDLACLTSLVRQMHDIDLTPEQQDLYKCMLGEYAGPVAQDALAADESEVFREHILLPDDIAEGRLPEYWDAPYFKPVFDAIARRGISRSTLYDAGVSTAASGWWGPEVRWQPTIVLPCLSLNGYVAGAKCMTLHPQTGKILKEYQPGSRAHIFGVEQIARRGNEWIILCEGELDALLLRERGWCAVSGTGGCKTFAPYFPAYFKDRDVLVVYDSDTEGRSGACMVERKLRGIARTIVIVDLFPDNDGTDKSRKDVTDYLIHCGHTDEEFVQVLNTAIGMQPSEQ